MLLHVNLLQPTRLPDTAVRTLLGATDLGPALQAYTRIVVFRTGIRHYTEKVLDPVEQLWLIYARPSGKAISARSSYLAAGPLKLYSCPMAASGPRTSQHGDSGFQLYDLVGVAVQETR